MLTNEQYTGSYVSGKQHQKAIGSSSKMRTPRSEWIVVKGSHPPIVSKAEFEQVQSILSSALKQTRVTKPMKAWHEGEIKCPKRRRVLNGESPTGSSIYGYAKRVGKTWQIDEPAASVVCRIYALFLDGLSIKEVRAILTSEKHPIPRDYLKMTKSDDIIASHVWTDASIRSILKNEQYTGAYVAGKALRDYSTGKDYYVPKKDWIVIPNRHPAIISKDAFDKVQGILATSSPKHKSRQPVDYLLRSKVKCGVCGHALAYYSEKIAVFRCYRNSSNPYAKCYKMKVTEKELNEAVMEIIKVQAGVVLASHADLSSAKKLLSRNATQSIAEIEKESASLMEQNQHLYEQFITGNIDNDTYQSLKSDCTASQDRLDVQLAILRQAMQSGNSNKKVASITKTALNTLTPQKEIVDALIDKIEVHPDSNLTIHWKIADFADVCRN